MNVTKLYLYIWNFWEKSIFANLPTDFLGIFRENPKTRSPHPV